MAKTSFLIFVLLASVVLIDYAASQCVILNEEWSDCGPACPATCDTLGQSGIGCIAVCVPSCVCKSGTVRNRWNNCVSVDKCRIQARALRQSRSNLIKRLAAFEN